MPLSFVLDEHLRGPLWHAVRQHNATGVDPIDVVRVGDPPDLPLGTADPDLLVWATGKGRILVSWDQRTLPGHLASHLQAGNHSPGIMVPRSGTHLPDLVDFLVLAAYASDPAEWQDQIRFVP